MLSNVIGYDLFAFSIAPQFFQCCIDSHLTHTGIRGVLLNFDNILIIEKLNADLETKLKEILHDF